MDSEKVAVNCKLNVHILQTYFANCITNSFNFTVQRLTMVSTTFSTVAMLPMTQHVLQKLLSEAQVKRHFPFFILSRKTTLQRWEVVLFCDCMKSIYCLPLFQITPPGTHIDIINWQSKLANYLSQADADDEEVVEHRMEERKIRGMFNVAFAT